MVRSEIPTKLNIVIESLHSARRASVASATPDDFNPLNRSQKLTTNSKMAIGESNQYGLTVLPKFGKMRKAKAQITHHADEITPNAANVQGIYLDLSHK